MAANFPDSPNTNDTFTSGALTFTWNGSAWKLDPSSGTKGVKGQKGEVGVTGDKGQKGEKGEVGTKGQKGEIGSTGGTGGTGAKGQKGEVGATGSGGSDGAKGQKGEVGATGSGGSAGDKGSTGDKGDKGAPSTVAGDKGQKGEVGATGSGGSTGSSGDKGQKGEEGPQGGGAPVGQIVAWSGSAGSLPSGYFLCDGSAISRSTYAALYDIVGTTHGSGNGSTTFNIPDLRDRFVVGASNSTGDTTYPGLSPGAANGIGAADATLVSHSHTVNNHTHSFSGSGSHSHSHTTDNYVGRSNYAEPRNFGVGTDGNLNNTGGTNSATVTISISGTTGGSTPGTNSQGSSATNANLPPYYALAYIIQYAQGGSTAKGQKGEVGATGSGGSTGDKGQKGEVGDKGAASSVQGPAGDKGQKGEVGATGSGGSTGSAGDKGQKGEVGTTGSTGSTGSAGSDGSDGAKGQKGEVGATGSGGSAGDKGQKGEVGATGSGGSAGSDGSDGDKGQKGDGGSTGATGPTLKPASATGGGALLTTNTSYQNVVNVTITPTQSNSHMMILATGTVGGEEGNNQNNSGTGTAQITRDTTQLGDTISSSSSQRNTRFDQVLIDTNNHGGSAVTYRIRLSKGGGNQAHAYLGGARSSNGSNSQGSARLLILELLQ